MHRIQIFGICLAVCMLLSGSLHTGAAAVAPDQVYMESDVSDAAKQQETIVDTGERPEYVHWLLDIARSELGYNEGENNYTKYGEWAGDANAAWCAEFLCWCVQQVDMLHGTSLLTSIYPNYSGQNTGRDWFMANGRFVFRKGNCPGWGYQWVWGENHLMAKNEYIPRPGDWVFFSYNNAGDTEHVAMVEYTAKDAEGNVILHVLEGNNPSSVQRNHYYLDNGHVLGFGTPETVVGTTMRINNQGNAVLALQKTLNRLELLEEKHITGTYGGHTKAAIMAFQKTMPNQNATGIADMNTQIAIANLIAEKEFNAVETWLVEE